MFPTVRILLITLILCLAMVTSVAAEEVIVTPGNTQGWTITVMRDSASVAITDTQPRAGNGSLEFSTVEVEVNGQDKADFELTWDIDTNRRLGTLTALSYEYFRASSSTVADHLNPVLRLIFFNDADTSGGFTTGDTLGYLIFEEAYNGSDVPEDSWKSVDIMTQNVFIWVTTGAPATGPVEFYGNTIAEWLEGSDNPSNAPEIDANTYIVGINVGIGSGWSAGTPTFQGFVDNVSIGFNGTTNTYNFELADSVEPPDDDDDEDSDSGGRSQPPEDVPVQPSTFPEGSIGQQTSGAITASGNNSAMLTPLVVNGDGNFAAVGDPNLINMGIVQAVDVFTFLPGGVMATTFEPPITVCLHGAGTVYFRPAADQTGTFVPAPAFPSGSYLCVTLYEPGLLVLVGTVTGAPAVQNVPATTTGASTPLTDCQVTTEYILRLRADANTSSPILDRLPMGTTVNASETRNGWFKVVFGDQEGWVSGDFVSTSANCG